MLPREVGRCFGSLPAQCDGRLRAKKPADQSHWVSNAITAGSLCEIKRSCGCTESGEVSEPSATVTGGHGSATAVRGCAGATSTVSGAAARAAASSLIDVAGANAEGTRKRSTEHVFAVG